MFVRRSSMKRLMAPITTDVGGLICFSYASLAFDFFICPPLQIVFYSESLPCSLFSDCCEGAIKRIQEYDHINQSPTPRVQHKWATWPIKDQISQHFKALTTKNKETKKSWNLCAFYLKACVRLIKVVYIWVENTHLKVKLVKIPHKCLFNSVQLEKKKDELAVKSGIRPLNSAALIGSSSSFCHSEAFFSLLKLPETYILLFPFVPILM